MNRLSRLPPAPIPSGVLAGVLAGVLGALAPGAGLAKGPVVVELFTAQGCASCKAANRLVAHMAQKPGIVALTWSVDYWDYLGWKDTFAQPAFAARQKAYARRLGPRDVYTPQVVVNGTSQVSGDDADKVEALVRAADRSRHSQPRIVLLASGKVSVRPGRSGHGHHAAQWLFGTADVWLVRFDPRESDVEIKAGDNRGATVVHRNVVRQVVRLGPWSGHAKTYPAPPPPEDGLASAVLVQGTRGGPIYAAVEALKPAS